MTRNIGTDAVIVRERFQQQTSHPSAPASGFNYLYIISGSSHGGLFLEDSAGRKIGPFITGSPSVAASNVFIQRVGNEVTFATGTSTTIPYDDSIPQSSEGYQHLSQTITPTSATNILYFDITIFGSIAAGDYLAIAVFQDNGANAIFATAQYVDTGTASTTISFKRKMVAGTTSPTTFKVRIGTNGGNMFFMNGRTSTGRVFGGIAACSIFIDEVTP